MAACLLLSPYVASCTFLSHMTTPSLDIICKAFQDLHLLQHNSSFQDEKIDSEIDLFKIADLFGVVSLYHYCQEISNPT